MQLLDTSPSAGDAPSNAELRANLEEALTIVFAHRDGQRADEDMAHSKALLLMVTAILLIVILAAFQNGILFLLGALGSLLSRLSRSLGAEGIVTHWIGLFLSPLAGALAGWAGVLIAAVLIYEEVLYISGIQDIQWSDPYALPALGLAFLLGFSERLFSQVTSVVQTQDVQQQASQQQQAGGGQR